MADADSEQLFLFDLVPYTTQQTPVGGEVLAIGKREKLKQIEVEQLELDLFPQHTDKIPGESIRLAA